MKYIKTFEKIINSVRNIRSGDIFRVEYPDRFITLSKLIRKRRETASTPTGMCDFEGYVIDDGGWYGDFKKFCDSTSTVLTNGCYHLATKEERALYREFDKEYKKKKIQQRFDL